MAKISDLKKDVNFLASEVITQCYITSQLFPQIKEETLNAVIEKSINFKLGFMKKINSYPTKGSKQEVKTYFREMETDLIAETQSLLTEIEDIRKTK